MKYRNTRVAFLAFVFGLAASLAGCAPARPGVEPRPAEVATRPAAEAPDREAAILADPVSYLRQVAANCRELDAYTLLFIRYERRGLLQRLYGPEHIDCRFRRAPFSIYMKWRDEDLKYFESVYVAGQQDNKVRFVTRWWNPPLAAPPKINRVDLQTPVTWGESKHPLTDFGLERLMERTLTALGEAGERVKVTYEGRRHLPQTNTDVHHLHLAYDEAFRKVPVQELYIDVATDLPAGTVLKTAAGQLDAAYYYVDLNTDVVLTDGDFLLAAERAAAPGAQAAGLDQPAAPARSAADSADPE